jgi:hypothetical protein
MPPAPIFPWPGGVAIYRDPENHVGQKHGRRLHVCTPRCIQYSPHGNPLHFCTAGCPAMHAVFGHVCIKGECPSWTDHNTANHCCTPACSRWEETYINPDHGQKWHWCGKWCTQHDAALTKLLIDEGKISSTTFIRKKLTVQESYLMWLHTRRL